MFLKLFVKNFRVLVRLNLIFVAFCLLVVTVGPSMAGLTHVLREMFEGKPIKRYDEIFSGFWDGFCKSFKQSCFYSVIMTAFFLFLFSIWDHIPFGLTVIPVLFVVLLSAYVFLMIVTVNSKLYLIIAYSAVMIVKRLKESLITAAYFAGVLAVTRFFPVLGFVGFFFITPALFGFVSFYYLYPCVTKHTAA